MSIKRLICDDLNGFLFVMRLNYEAETERYESNTGKISLNQYDLHAQWGTCKFHASGLSANCLCRLHACVSYLLSEFIICYGYCICNLL